MEWLKPGWNVLKEDDLNLEVHKVFEEADYTVLDYPYQFQLSCQRICKFLIHHYADQEIYLTGTGTSGAMVMALIQHYMLHAGLASRPKMCFIILKKEGEKTHRTDRSVIRSGTPIFIVDDHIASGSTMFNLASTIHKSLLVSRGGLKVEEGAIMYVHGIIAENTTRLLERDGFYARVHRKNIKELYPNLKYLLS